MASPTEAGASSPEPVLELVHHARDESRTMLALHPGERMALVGTADAGREAVIQGLAGLEPLFLRPVGERLYGTTHLVLGGVDLTVLRPHQRRRFWARLGVVFERGGLWTGRSALYNLELPFRYHRVASSPEWQARRDALVEHLDLGGCLSREVVELDLSQRRRVALARELLKSPSVLLFDEPQLGLSDVDRQRVSELLDDECENGLALVYGDIDGDLAPFVADSFCELADARLVPIAEPPESAFQPRSSYTPLELRAPSLPPAPRRRRRRHRMR